MIVRPGQRSGASLPRLLLLLMLAWRSIPTSAGASDCLPSWTGQLLVPAPTPGLPGWTVEKDTGSAGSLAVVTNQAGTNIEFSSFPEPERDTDRDGQPDWAELIAGTDPLDPTSCFVVDRVGFDTGSGALRLSWASVTNRFYTVFSATTLPGAWSPVAGYTRVPGTGQRLEFSAPAAGSTARFFRIQCGN